MCLSKQRSILLNQSPSICNERRYRPLSICPSRSSGSMQKLLDRVGHLIDNHIIDTKIDSSLQKRRSNENIESSYSLHFFPILTFCKRTHNRVSNPLRVLTVDSTAMKLFLAEFRHQIFNRSDAIHENQDRRLLNHPQHIQQLALAITMLLKANESILEGDEEAVDLDIRAELSLQTAQPIRADSDCVDHAAVD